MTESQARDAPASIASSEALVDALVNTQLLAQAEVDQVRQELGVRFPDPRSLADDLVAKSKLTPYQADQILQGKASDLVVGGCRILEPLGQGGMGQVFKAEQCRLNRIVALKVIHPNCLGGPDAVRRFQREACVAATLSHPNVITIYDAGQDGSTHFLVMEYAAGMDLARLIARAGPLPVGAACRLVGQAALGLQHAHERGMIHRDIKPSNLFIARPVTTGRTTTAPSSVAAEVHLLLGSGVLKILDMGLARLTESPGGAPGTLTEDGKVVGTPDFIAPEQARSARLADIRSDIYSLGCALYHTLTGRLPFPEGSLVEKLLMHQLDEPEPAEQLRPDLPPPVVAILRRMMAKKPEARYQIPYEVYEAFAAVADSATPPAPSSPPAPSKPSAPPAAPPLVATRIVLPDSSVNRLTPTAISPVGLDTKSDPKKPPAQRVTSGIGDNSGTAAPPVTTTARELMSLTGHKGCALCLAFGPDRNTLASAGVDETIRVWDFSRGEPRELAVLEVPKEEVSSLLFLDRRVLAAGTDRGKILVWDLATRDLDLLCMVQGHRQRVTALTATSDGRALASAGADHDVHIWDCEGDNLRLRATLAGHADGATAVAIAPDGKHIATGAQDGSVRLWMPRRYWNRELDVARLPRATVSSLAFAPEGGLLACGCSDKTFHVWDLKDDKLHKRSDLRPCEGKLRQVCFPPGEGTLVTLDDKGRRCAFDSSTGGLVETWTVPISSIYSYALTYDGRYLATGGSDGRILVYRTAQKRKKT
jgi:serine/threonine-protein kinase